MLKKIIISLMVSVLCTQQSLAGSRNSTLFKEDQEYTPKITRNFSPLPPNDSEDDGVAIVAEMKTLTISARANDVLYKFVQESSSPDKHSPVNFEEDFPRSDEERFSYINENFSLDAWRKDSRVTIKCCVWRFSGVALSL